MAYLAASARREAIINPNLSNLSSSLSLRSHHFFFCTATETPTHQDSTFTAQAYPEIKQPLPNRPIRRPRVTGDIIRRPRRVQEKTEEIICRMMYNRAWTTRLQNSIRALVPVFDHQLVCNVLDNAARSDHALNFFRWVGRSNLFQHNRDTHYKIIQILGRAQKLNHARCILMDMPKYGIPWDEDLWIVLIDSYGRAGIVQESVKFLRMMDEFGVQRTVKAYDCFFNVILRTPRRAGVAKRYYNKMLAQGIQPTLVTFNILISGFFRNKQACIAKRFFREMKSKGIAPNAVTYNTLINGCFHAHEVEEADKYFVEMKASDIELSVITYNTRIKGYVMAERVDDALRVYEEMKGVGIMPTEFTYAKLLPGLCDAEKMEEAKGIFKEMAANSIRVRDNEIFTKQMSGQCKAGDLDGAVYVLKAMSMLGIPIEAGHYGMLIESCCKAKEYDRAVQLLDKLIEKEIILRPENTLHLEPSAYNPMIEYLCKNGQTGKAEALLRQLMKLGIKDPVAFNNLVCGHANEGAPESAFEFIQIMVRRKVDTEKSAYDSIIESYLKKNEPADAKTALDSMIENGHLPDSSVYRSLMESLFEDGRIQTASRVMKTMLEKGVKDHEDLINKILEAVLLRGHVEEGLGRIELLMNSGVALNIDNLISILCEKEKPNAALKILDFGLERGYDIQFSSYEKVLDALLASGKTIDAYSILCKFIQKGGVSHWSNCKDLIKSLNNEGNTRQADILSRMIQGQSGGKKGKKKAAVAS